jgi:hypothetical protein
VTVTSIRELRNAQYLERLAGRLGATCLICGRGPYVKLGVHTAKLHGVTRDQYRRLFPGADMTHPDLRDAFRLEAEENGAGPRNRQGKRSRTCRRGHALRGSNVIVDNLGRRKCKRCDREAHRARAWRISEASGAKLCECGCGTAIPGIGLNGKDPRRFVFGHRQGRRPLARGETANDRRRERRRRRQEAAGTKLCECGCGTEIFALTANHEPARFVKGHHRRIRS